MPEIDVTYEKLLAFAESLPPDEWIDTTDA